MTDERTVDEKIDDLYDCIDALEALKEFCVTEEAVKIMHELEDILLDYYTVK